MPHNDWTCPVCAQPNSADALECINCLCSVDADELDIKQRKQDYADHIGTPESSDNDGAPITKKKSLLGYLAIFMVLVPLVVVAAGYTLDFLIPGCVMGGENGAHGCHLNGTNLDSLVTFLGVGGSIYLVLGFGTYICVVLPAWVIVMAWKDFRGK